MPKPKILCLHGGGSNSDITVFQTMGLSLTKHMECMYVDAPHIVNYCYPGLNRLSDGPFRVWAMPHGASESDQQSQWDQSLQFLADYCNEHGPFEGVYGFSQGTAMITSMSHPSIWKERFNMESCPWKFAICACGGASFQISIPKDISVPLKIPSFHIFGAKDNHLQDSKTIAEYWDTSQKMTYTHNRGHEIDVQMGRREKELIATLNKFLDKYLLSGKEAEGVAVGMVG